MSMVLIVKRFFNRSFSIALFSAIAIVWQGSNARCQESTQISAAEQAVQAAIESRDLSAVYESLRALAPEKRLAYLGQLSDLRAASSTSAAGSSASTLGLGGSSSTGAGGGDRSSSGQGPVGGQGGVTRANFTELIQLIQNTIEGRWDEGTDTIEPFPSGVWIDAAGAIKMTRGDKTPSIKNLKQPIREAILLPTLGVFQESSDLRWISLTELDRQLRQRIQDNKTTSLSMELLGGLTRIDFVAWNDQSQEWLIGGPAGDLVLDANGELVSGKTKLPPVLLEDLLSIAPHILNQRGPMGCSIDPVPERLKAASDFVASNNSRKELAKNPAKWTQQLLEKIGPQQVSIFGIPNDSPAGAALIMADHHLKRLGLGIEPGPTGLTNYLKEAERLDAFPDQGLVRWWFALKPSEIGCDEAHQIFELPNDPVDLLSEQQWADQRGDRRATGKADVAADGFAKDFTAQFDLVAEKYPIYGRLRHIFSLATALQVIRNESNDIAERQLETLSDTAVQPHLRVRPQWIDSVSTTRTFPGKRTVAIVSGGVKLDTRNVKSYYTLQSQGLPPTSELPTAEKAKHESWWR